MTPTNTKTGKEGKVATHTPGPWAIDPKSFMDKNSVDISVFGKYGKNKKFVCAIYGEGALSPDVVERDANARLIAAAPELLAALKEARAELKHYSSDHLNVIARIDALLQKAQGRS